MSGTSRTGTTGTTGVHGDLVLRARVRLLSHNERVLHGEEGLWVYRTLFAVSPRVYAFKLALVLREAAEGPRVARLPGARAALLAQARAASARIPADAPVRQVRMWEYSVTELRLTELRLTD